MIIPGATIGILGGGQLGRMIAMAAAQLGYRCRVYAPDRESVAAAHFMVGQSDWLPMTMATGGLSMAIPPCRSAKRAISPVFATTQGGGRLRR